MRKKKLKFKVRVLNADKEIYFGKPLDLPVKDSYIIQKSIELFDDEDPCIIHQSYVVKEYADFLIELFQSNETSFILGKDFSEELSFLDYENLTDLTFELVG